MTKEKAKEILISTLRDINSDDDGFEYTTEQFTEAMLIAIESLSNHSLPSNLEEAATEFATQDCVTFISRKKGFIAGVEWQREQDQSLIELAEDHAMLAGMNKMKEEMMEKAVGGRYMKAASSVYVESWLLDIDPDSVKAGDEVSLIVLPKE